MKQRFLFFLFVIFIFHSKSIFAQFSASDQKIASGFYTFIVNTDWQNEKNFKQFVIGILDKDSSFYELCVKKYEGIRLKNCPAKIELYHSTDRIKDCHVLYVNKKFNKDLEDISKKLKDKNTLLITNSCKNDKLTMINYNNLLKKKEYEINDENIKKAGLKLSSKFFDFAEDKISWQELYIQSVSSLEKEREKVEQQEKKINYQEGEIYDQKMSLEEKQKLISAQEADFRKQREILKLQQEEIQVHQNEIDEQKGVLIKQLEEIEKQKLILILLGVVLVLTVLMILVVFRSYRVKKLAHKKLEEKNQAILQQKEEIEAQREMLYDANTELFKLAIVAQETDNSIVISDKDGNLEWANAGFTRLFGFTLDEFKKLRGGNIIEASVNPNVREAINECLAKKKSVMYVLPTEIKYGEPIWIQTTLTPILDENGEISKLVAVDTDVSKIKNAEEEIRVQKTLVEEEKKKSDELLLNILPTETAEELKNTGRAVPRYYKNASILFTDFKGFTKSCESLSPEELARELNRYFVKFDEIIDKYNIEKIKTIGDAYMCAAGLPTSNKTHAIDITLAGLEIQNYMKDLNKCKSDSGIPIWELRLGIHTGEVITGVVGKRKFAFDIWGDTVNVASRMESSGEIGKINISLETYEQIKNFFDCTYRGKLEAKNKGKIDMYFVNRLLPEFSSDELGLIPNEKFKRTMLFLC